VSRGAGYPKGPTTAHKGLLVMTVRCTKRTPLRCGAPSGRRRLNEEHPKTTTRDPAGSVHVPTTAASRLKARAQSSSATTPRLAPCGDHLGGNLNGTGTS